MLLSVSNMKMKNLVMAAQKNIRLKKMVHIGTPAADANAPLIYLTAAQAAAMEELKKALTRPADEPRRMGNIQDALYTLTHGPHALSEAQVQKEVDNFLAARELEAQNRAKKLAETFADMTGKTRASPQKPQSTKRGGPRPFFY